MSRTILRQTLIVCVSVLLLSSCGGGGGSSTPPTPPPPTPPPTTPPVSTGDCSNSVSSGPFTTAWPDSAGWILRSPESQGLCSDDLEELSDYAFGIGNSTGAVLVIKNGYLVFERYSANRSRDDLATSWSVGKSFTSMLLGIAMDEGSLTNLDTQKVAQFVPLWVDTTRDQITLYHMMTVRTALRTLDATAFYGSTDQLTMAIDRPLIGEPGKRLYNYTNADVMIAGEVLKRATGMDAETYLNERVSTKLGMTTEWWDDGEGNVLTYCCIDAKPRDFARFGLLYARNGEWDGEQIVSKAWIDRTTEIARTGSGNPGDTDSQVGIDGGYGYYWWQIGNGGFGAFGLHSQIIAIYPEDDLVFLRFSEYLRLGDGTPRRVGGNFHNTIPPTNFSNARFLELAYESLR